MHFNAGIITAWAPSPIYRSAIQMFLAWETEQSLHWIKNKKRSDNYIPKIRFREWVTSNMTPYFAQKKLKICVASKKYKNIGFYSASTGPMRLLGAINSTKLHWFWAVSKKKVFYQSKKQLECSHVLSQPIIPENLGLWLHMGHPNMKKSGSYSDVFQAWCRCVRISRSK